MGARGYVVRGTDKRGNVVTGDGITTTDAAVRAMRLLEWGHCTDVAIFRVHDDGAEERLPSYEEALGEIERLRADVAGLRAGLLDAAGQSRRLGAVIADPLAALEAAERRLLEAGGWRPSGNADYSGYWHGQDGRMYKQAVAILAERRRLAAKGGA